MQRTTTKRKHNRVQKNANATTESKPDQPEHLNDINLPEHLANKATNKKKNLKDKQKRKKMRREEENNKESKKERKKER